MLHWLLQQTLTKGKRVLLDWTNPIGKCLESFITSLYNHVRVTTKPNLLNWPVGQNAKKESCWRRISWKTWELRDGLTKKSSCSSGFCPNEGGGEGPAQIFCPLFTNCIYWVNFGMGREGETPAQIFWHIGVKKSGTSCPN